MMYLIINRSSLEYNSEGNYYDCIDNIVYNDSSIIGYWMFFIAIIGVIIFLGICLKFIKKQ